MIDRIDNDGAEACQRLAERCFEKYVTHGRADPLPENLRKLRLEPGWRRRAMARGDLLLIRPAPTVSMETMLRRERLERLGGRRAPGWGKVTRLARHYLAHPRLKGDLISLAKHNSVDPVKLQAAVKREIKNRMEAAA